MRISARLISFFLILFFSAVLFFPKSASAQQFPINPNFESDVPPTIHNLTQGILIDILSAFSCQLGGIDPVNPNGKCLGVDPQSGKIGFVEQGNGGVVGVMGEMIAMLYTPPVHTTDFIAYMGNNFGISKHTYAAEDCKAGYGFCSIQPLTKIWSGFRNIVYMVFVLIFIVIGIAIMLRVKIDPRTVMTIENQIPKILIGIIMVTFSFAIAGFLIDIMFIGIYIVFDIFSKVLSPDSTTKLYSTTANLQNDTALGVFNTMFGFFSLTNDVSDQVKFFLQDITDNISVLSHFFATHTVSLFGNEVELNPFAQIPRLIAYFVIIIALLWAMFRVWFQLLMAYMGILIDIVTAPFWIMAGTMPGGFGGVSLWFRDLISNLLAFPTVIVILLLGRSFMDAFEGAYNSGQQVFVPPMVGNFKGSIFGAIIGFGTLLIAPKALDYMRNALKAPKFDFTPISTALGKGNPLGAVGSASQIGSSYFGLTHFGKMATGVGGFMGRLGRKTAGEVKTQG